MALSDHKKISLFAALAAASLLVTGCGGVTTNDDVDYTPIEKKDPVQYSIAVVQDAADPDASVRLSGFSDAISDLFGSDHCTISVQTAGGAMAAPDIVTSMLNDDPDLLFASGGESVLAAAAKDTDTPVVLSGVMDYHSFLGLPADDWTDPLGGNLCGVSDRPPLADFLSLVIESTADLKSVGFLYTPDDTDAILQDQILEGYLDQAGIPWKEYAAAPDAVTASRENATAAARNSYFSAKGFLTGEAANEIGKDLRPARQSNGYSTAAAADGASPVDAAIAENSVVVLSANSDLASQAASIASAAASAHVPLVSCDATVGAYTLSCLYTDPYAFGYAAGKQAYRILVRNEDPGKMAVETAPAKTSVKLYQDSYAAALGLTFPKSFHEFDAYLAENAPGATTERVKNPGDLSDD